MGNFAESFNALAGGLVGGYEAGQKAQLRSLQIDEAARGKRFTDKLSEGLGGQKEKPNFFQRLFNGYNEAWDRATGKQDVLKVRGDTTTTGGSTDTATVTGGDTYKVDTKREPNVEGGPSTAGITPRAGATGADLGPRTSGGTVQSWQSPDEGTSRLAYTQQNPASQDRVMPSGGISPTPAPGSEVQGSSGGVAPPGATPSPQATAIADRAVRSVGGTPTRRPDASSTDVPGPGAAAAAGVPGQPTMVGREPPGGAPQGPAAPISEPGRYPGDVGATARRAGGITLQNPTVQQQAPDQGSNVIPFKPVQPAGGIATPADQKVQADVVRMANQPVPKGSQPDDLIKAIVPKDAPEGTLPTSQHLVDKLEAVMPELYKIDPERAVRLYGQTVEAMRIGMQHGLMRAQAAFEAGDANGAQRMLMIAYNKYVLNGTKAQFDVGKDGKSMTMQLFDEKSGKEMGKPTPVTQDMLAKMGVIATSPPAYAQYLQHQATIEEQKRHNIKTEALHGASIASAAADRAEARRQHDVEFRWKMHEQNQKTYLDGQREDRLEARDKQSTKIQDAAMDRQRELADETLAERRRKLEAEGARKVGRGWTDPTDAESRQHATDINNLLGAGPPATTGKNPTSAETQEWTQLAPRMATYAKQLMQWNSGMSADEAVSISRRLARNEPPTEGTRDDKGKFTMMKYGDVEFAVPDSMRPTRREAPGGTTSPPAAGGAPPTSTSPQGAVPPATTQGAIPPRGTDSGRGQLPTVAPQTLDELRTQTQASDAHAAELRQRQQERQDRENAASDQRTAAAQAQFGRSLKDIQAFPHNQQMKAVEVEARRIAKETGGDYDDIYQQLLARLQFQRRQPGAVTR